MLEGLAGARLACGERGPTLTLKSVFESISIVLQAMFLDCSIHPKSLASVVFGDRISSSP